MNFAKFKTFDDLVRFVATSQIPFIFTMIINGKYLYFVHIMLVESLVYYAEMDVPIKERYVVYNRFKDQVVFSDKLEIDPQKSFLPILAIESASVFSNLPI